MQKIRINNKIFNSLSKAAKFLQKNKGWLSNEMKNKQAITYKDLFIEKIESPKTKKIPKHTKKGIPVLIDGVMYKNCSEAERAIGCSQSSVSDALRRGAKTIYGHTLEAVYPSMLKNRKPLKKRTNVKVLCKTTGITYDSIREAALVAGVDDWTMSKKMESAGSFIDKNNNEYVRLKPMKTKNIYENTGKTLLYERTPSTKLPNMQGCTDLNEVNMGNFCNPLTEVNLKEKECPKIIKEAIANKIKELMKEKGIWEEIVEMLDFCNVDEFKIVK